MTQDIPDTEQPQESPAAVGEAPPAAQGDQPADTAVVQEPQAADSGKAKAKAQSKGEGKGKPKAEGAAKGKPKDGAIGEGKGKPKDGATGEGKGKPKDGATGEGKGKPKAEGAAKGKPKTAGAGKGKGKAQAEAKAPRPPEEKLPPRLKVRYREEILPELMRELGVDNAMDAPRVEKVVINMGVGAATQDPKALEGAAKELAEISGQRPAITRARKSIAAFKVRENNPVGCRVTLRGDRMYEFLDRLFNAALPRIRDFRGLPARSFDGRGNYTMGVREQIIFPELNMDEIERVRGMDITITTTAKTDEHGRALLTKLGLPLRES